MTTRTNENQSSNGSGRSGNPSSGQGFATRLYQEGFTQQFEDALSSNNSSRSDNSAPRLGGYSNQPTRRNSEDSGADSGTEDGGDHGSFSSDSGGGQRDDGGNDSGCKADNSNSDDNSSNKKLSLSQTQATTHQKIDEGKLAKPIVLTNKFYRALTVLCTFAGTLAFLQKVILLLGTTFYEVEKKDDDGNPIINKNYQEKFDETMKGDLPKSIVPAAEFVIMIAACLVFSYILARNSILSFGKSCMITILPCYLFMFATCFILRTLKFISCCDLSKFGTNRLFYRDSEGNLHVQYYTGPMKCGDPALQPPVDTMVEQGILVRALLTLLSCASWFLTKIKINFLEMEALLFGFLGRVYGFVAKKLEWDEKTTEATKNFFNLQSRENLLLARIKSLELSMNISLRHSTLEINLDKESADEKTASEFLDSDFQELRELIFEYHSVALARKQYSDPDDCSVIAIALKNLSSSAKFVDRSLFLSQVEKQQKHGTQDVIKLVLKYVSPERFETAYRMQALDAYYLLNKEDIKPSAEFTTNVFCLGKIADMIERQTNLHNDTSKKFNKKDCESTISMLKKAAGEILDKIDVCWKKEQSSCLLFQQSDTTKQKRAETKTLIDFPWIIKDLQEKLLKNDSYDGYVQEDAEKDLDTFRRSTDILQERCWKIFSQEEKEINLRKKAFDFSDKEKRLVIQSYYDIKCFSENIANIIKAIKNSSKIGDPCKGILLLDCMNSLDKISNLSLMFVNVLYPQANASMPTRDELDEMLKSFIQSKGEDLECLDRFTTLPLRRALESKLFNENGVFNFPKVHFSCHDLQQKFNATYCPENQQKNNVTPPQTTTCSGASTEHAVNPQPQALIAAAA